MIVKPNAIARGLGAIIESAIHDAGLSILCSHTRAVSGVCASLWRSSVPAECVFEHALLECEYVGRPIQYHVVQGVHALERTRALKSAIRARYARGPFANVVHAPDDDVEWATQLETLRDDCAACASTLAAAGADTWRPVPDVHAVVSHSPADGANIADLVRRWWIDPASPVWCPEAAAPVVLGDPALARASIVVHGCERVPGDIIIHALTHGVGLGLEAAVALALRAAHDPHVELVRMSPSAANELAAVLRARYSLEFCTAPCAVPPPR